MGAPLHSTTRFLPRIAAEGAIFGRPDPPPPSLSPAAVVPTFSPQAFHAHLASVAPHLSCLLAALSRARAARLPLLPATRALAASALLRHGRLHDALAHFSLLQNSSGAALPALLCNSLLAALAASGSLAHARKVLDRMLTGAVELDTVGFGVFVKAVSRRDGLMEVLRLVDVVGSRGDRISRSVVAAMVVDGLCREGRIEDAWQALEDMRLRAWKPDFVAYRIVSEGFRVAGRAEEEGRILKQKRKLGVAPRNEDYGKHVLALLSNRQIAEAKEIAVALVLGDFPIDDDVLNALIGSVSESDDAAAAAMFCNFMLEKGRFPCTEILVHLCENLCKNRKGDEMWRIFTLLLEKGYCNNARDYHLMVSFLSKAGKVREAYDLLKEMKRKRLEPDISSYNSLMEALCRNDLLRPAKKLWDEMFTIGCRPNLQTYNILITKFAEIGKIEEAQQLFDHMIQKGVVPDYATYTSVITILCKGNKYEQAVEIFNTSLMHDAAVASSVLTVFVRILCEQGNFEGASSVISRVPSNVENLNSHVILLKSLTDAGKVEMAIEHINWIKSNCGSSLHNIVNELMVSLSTSTSLQHVTKLIQHLYSRSLFGEPDPWRKLTGNVYA